MAARAGARRLLVRGNDPPQPPGGEPPDPTAQNPPMGRKVP